MRMLKQHGPQRYTDILFRRGLEKDESGYFSYYIKNLVEFSLINLDRRRLYSITKKGKILLNFHKKFETMYITENQNEICTNSTDKNDNKHNWIKICGNCSLVEIK